MKKSVITMFYIMLALNAGAQTRVMDTGNESKAFLSRWDSRDLYEALQVDDS